VWMAVQRGDVWKGRGVCQLGKCDNILKIRDNTFVVGRLDRIKGRTCESGNVVGQVSRRTPNTIGARVVRCWQGKGVGDPPLVRRVGEGVCLGTSESPGHPHERRRARKW
jgi:hypothetical protein